MLQLDEVNLYSAGTALLEQNLHTLDSLRIFNDKVNKLSVGISKLCMLECLLLFLLLSFKIRRDPSLNMNFCVTGCEYNSLLAHKNGLNFAYFFIKE